MLAGEKASVPEFDRRYDLKDLQDALSFVKEYEEELRYMGRLDDNTMSWQRSRR